MMTNVMCMYAYSVWELSLKWILEKNKYLSSLSCSALHNRMCELGPAEKHCYFKLYKSYNNTVESVMAYSQIKVISYVMESPNCGRKHFQYADHTSSFGGGGIIWV